MFGLFRHINVSTKLLLSSLASLVALLAVGIMGGISLANMDAQLQRMYSGNVLGIEKAGDAERAVRRIAVASADYVLADPADRSSVRQDIQNYDADFAKAIEEYLPIIVRPQERDIINRLRQAYGGYMQAVNQLVAAQNSDLAMQVLHQQVTPKRTEVNNVIAELVQSNAQMAEDIKKEADAMYRRVQFTFVIVIVAGVGLSLGLNLLVSRTITKPLALVTAAAGRVAEGDLRGETVTVNTRDEIGRLTDSFNQMAGNLKSLLRQIADAAESVASASEEMSAGTEQSSQAVAEVSQASQELAAGAGLQSRKVQDTMASTEEFSAAIQQIASTAQQVAAAAQVTSRRAEDGDQAMRRAGAEMDKITTSSREISGMINELGNRSQAIGQIVDLISGIANQTNLLALNAAIEAARVGEHGRGFAVVADEVRKLAEQSGQAAQDIADLIRQVQEDTSKAVEAMESNAQVVESGWRVITEGAGAFQQIKEDVNSVSRQIQEVSRSTEELAKGSEEIVNAITAIGEIAQHVSEASQSVAAGAEEQSASIEELASSAEFLANLGQQLQQAVLKFKL
ncbi:methyl-accepting chemotaxis protein [Kyrpidia tusciae]|uniref:Methyl-accepting chemotaxis sensory transducer n=1 Tax=Kyrpidia tusciae (strain DSM 2912 / NBRC 15312 / T2) TaxID=562970 RepID=D5WSC7_KYRT2|nr:methyl-accepting chemotaxis protein [Kyrpidia tusciae]ADG05012.1 methyl-accepting chemotaxis sensory transducer [Kyrpidia tusciae DSM 2912]